MLAGYFAVQKGTHKVPFRLGSVLLPEFAAEWCFSLAGDSHGRRLKLHMPYDTVLSLPAQDAAAALFLRFLWVACLS